MSDDAREAYDALCCWTLGRGDATFVHQHVVDAYAAQSATPASKPIGIVFALVGLYLHTERGRDGRFVQRVHMALARRRRDWPVLALPEARGDVTARDVLAAPEGPGRDAAIDAWCASVWDAYRAQRATIVALLEEHGLA
ncbi:MAG: hypothetical protein H6825_08430 [Planctomycetes bacterium]|nr:hypothetical protein [Planctomycetota bacterium]